MICFDCPKISICSKRYYSSRNLYGKTKERATSSKTLNCLSDTLKKTMKNVAKTVHTFYISDVKTFQYRSNSINEVGSPISEHFHIVLTSAISIQHCCTSIPTTAVITSKD